MNGDLRNRVVALSLFVVALVVLALVVVRAADARDGVDRMPKAKIERASIVAAATGGIRSSRYGHASPWLRRLSRELVERSFRGDARRWALCVVDRESGWNPGAISRTGDYGLPQINRASHRWVDFGRILVDPPYAVAVMHRLSNGGRSRGPWEGGGRVC